ncbi:MAG: hypothetical protein WBP25_03010 [Giesbergeria sp.]|jgi:hypothetical protein
MARELSESDWKVLKQLHSIALERFCQRVLSEVDGIVADTSKTSHQRYLAMYEAIQRRDKEISRVFDDLRRSTAILQLAALRSRKLIEDAEFMRFSEETQGLVGVFLEAR